MSITVSSSSLSSSITASASVPLYTLRLENVNSLLHYIIITVEMAPTTHLGNLIKGLRRSIDEDAMERDDGTEREKDESVRVRTKKNRKEKKIEE